MLLSFNKNDQTYFFFHIKEIDNCSLMRIEGGNCGGVSLVHNNEDGDRIKREKIADLIYDSKKLLKEYGVDARNVETLKQLVESAKLAGYTCVYTEDPKEEENEGPIRIESQ